MESLSTYYIEPYSYILEIIVVDWAVRIDEKIQYLWYS